MKELLFGFSLLVLTLISCNKHDCPEGYDCVSDACICSEDKFEGHGMCRDLKDNEYYGVSDCLFKDTVFIEFVQKKADGFYESYIDFGNSISTTGILYTEYENFDSIYYSRKTMPGLLPSRKHEGKSLFSHINGRLYKDRFEGYIEWRVLFNPDELIERCEFNMVTK